MLTSRTRRARLRALSSVAMLGALAACSAGGIEPQSTTRAGADEPRASAAPAASVEPAVTAAAAPAPPEEVTTPTVIDGDGQLASARGHAERSDGRWVVGDGSPESCTSAALVRATREGGDVVFDCGPAAHTIAMEETLTVCSTFGCAPEGAPIETLRLHGGGTVTLSGRGERPLLYAHTCEPSLGTVDGACERRATPHLVLEELRLVDGYAGDGPAGLGGPLDLEHLGGGGAVAMRGGRLTLINTVVSGHRCGEGGTGGAILAIEAGAPAEISGSTLTDNGCARGGALALSGTEARVTGTSVLDNAASVAGGGVWATGTEQGLHLALVTLAGNDAPAGTAIDYAVAGGEFTVRRVRIDGHAPTPEDPGAGVRSDSALTAGSLEHKDGPSASPTPSGTPSRSPSPGD